MGSRELPVGELRDMVLHAEYTPEGPLAKKTVNYANREGWLSSWEKRFYSSILQQDSPLTPTQTEKLSQVNQKVTSKLKERIQYWERVGQLGSRPAAATKKVEKKKRKKVSESMGTQRRRTKKGNIVSTTDRPWPVRLKLVQHMTKYKNLNYTEALEAEGCSRSTYLTWCKRWSHGEHIPVLQEWAMKYGNVCDGITIAIPGSPTPPLPPDNPPEAPASDKPIDLGTTPKEKYEQLREHCTFMESWVHKIRGRVLKLVPLLIEDAHGPKLSASVSQLLNLLVDPDSESEIRD